MPLAKFMVKGIADDACKRASNVVLIELLDVHYRGIILSAEPLEGVQNEHPPGFAGNRLCVSPS